MSTASGILANVFPGAMADVVDPPRCIATVRLPCQVWRQVIALQGQHARDAREGRPALGGLLPEKHGT